jgi:beta-barrel assembly-enhancing protease
MGYHCRDRRGSAIQALPALRANEPRSLIRLLRPLILALTALLACVSLLLTAGCSATRMSEKDEIRIGQEAAAQIEKQYRTSEDPTVSRAGQRIAAASDKPNLPYRFRVVDQDEVNAFALPGGPVYVTDELLKAIGNDEDQLAGVLGHEVGHITKRHSVRQMERQNWFGLGIEVLTSGNVQDVATIAANLQLLSYSRDQEYEADRKGVQYSRAAGFDPMGLVRFLDHLASLEKGGASIPWLRTHPGSEPRADRLRKQLSQTAR